MTELLANRIAQLKAMHWKKQKAIADSLGLQKPETTDWDDFCDEIAKAENDNERLAKLTEPSAMEPIVELIEPTIVATTTPAIAVTVLVDSQIYTPHGNHCHVCSQKLRTNETGFICPILDIHCPRNQKVE